MWRFVIVGLFACGKSESKLDQAQAPVQLPAVASSPGYCRNTNSFTPTTPVGTQAGSATKPVHTFSIVARDPVTGDLGVAVQSHWFSVGPLVAWAEPGVGAVATQSFVDPGYGPRGLALMRDGVAAPAAMAQLVAADAQSAVRQLGFVDSEGRAASHTGARCIAHAASHAGDGYAVQANLMANDKVVPAMRTAFESTKGDLAERMLAALDAAQAVGGDIRGCQSAAILVVSGKRSATPWAEKKFDLRVEDHAAPLVELRRLVTLARAYDHMNQGDLAVEKGDMAAAAKHYSAATRMVPDSAEMTYWSGIAFAARGDLANATPLLKRAFAADPAWIELTRRLPASGLLPDAAAAERAIEAAR
jgi:uncharacterized Ntn-hydrolase superfamily protein